MIYRSSFIVIIFVSEEQELYSDLMAALLGVIWVLVAGHITKNRHKCHPSASAMAAAIAKTRCMYLG